MAEIDFTSNLTLSEIVNREDPKGGLADLVDVMSVNSSIVKTGTWEECNRGTYHEDTLVASRPSGSLRGYDMGVDKEASSTEKDMQPTCMLDGLSQIDSAKLQHSAGGGGPLRVQEDDLFMAGMAENVTTQILEGDRAGNYGLAIDGIVNRSDYNALALPNVYDNAGGDASATANKTFMLIMQWGAKKCNLIYPRNDPHGGGTQYGIKLRDFGEDIVTDAAGKSYPAWRTWFEAHFGLFIYDARCVKLIVNISTTNIDGIDDFSFNEDYLIDAYVDLRYPVERTYIYCNAAVEAQMWKRVKDKSNVNFSEGTAFGSRVAMFNGIPIMREEKIGSTYATWV